MKHRVYSMKHAHAFLILVSLAACNNSSINDRDKTIVETVPVSVNLSPLATAIHSSITDIETKEITTAGEIIGAINIEGMEIMNISMKDYYINELRSQEEDFKKYLDYLDNHSKNKNMNNPVNRQISEAKHNAVIAYLEKMIKTASTKTEIYKVIYYLKADTKSFRYDQLKTIYLDKELKKIVADYRFLKPAF